MNTEKKMDKIQLPVKKFAKETRSRGEFPPLDREHLQKKKKKSYN